MDSITFLGYVANSGFIKACTTERTAPMELENFYNAVNQDTKSGGCSCCKQGVTVYAMYATWILAGVLW